MQDLNSKEMTAVEMRYLGMTHEDIALRTGMPKPTVDDWFKSSRGRLSPYFQKYSEEMNDARKRNLENLYEETDKETLLVIKAFLRNLKEVLLNGYKKPIIKNGEVQLDEQGNVRYYYEPYKVTVSDFMKAWKIHQIMQDRPTEIKHEVCWVCKDRIEQSRGRV
ncbi:MAG: hypothetical protein WAV09_02790 [Minisyncoccia bacterium]